MANEPHPQVIREAISQVRGLRGDGVTLGLYVAPENRHLLEPHMELLEAEGVRVIDEPGLDGFSLAPVADEEDASE